MAAENNDDDQKERSIGTKVADFLRESVGMEVKEQESQSSEEAIKSLRRAGGRTPSRILTPKKRRVKK